MAKPITKEYLRRTLKNYETEVTNKKYLFKLKKLETAEDGFFSSYKLYKELDETEEAVGDVINIPKDFLVKKAEVKTCEEDDTPEEGYKVGDKYIDFTVNTKDAEEDETDNESHLYIKFKDLVDLTAGGGISIENGGTVSVNYGEGLRIGTEDDGDDEGKLLPDFETEDIDFSDWDKEEGGGTDPIIP